jgi:hypothetical protein
MGHSDSDRPIAKGAEQRASVRVVYETLLLVAEFDGTTFPPFSAFWEVRTKDLSPTGVGFHSAKRPASELLLLLFGNPQANPIFVKARVAHCKENVTPKGTVYTVGCELLERIKG